MKLVIALIAALALITLDYVSIAVLFLYRPTGGGALAIAMLAGALAAVALRWRWLFLATQNALTILLVVRLLQSEGPLEARDIVGVLISFFLIVVLGNGLAWLVTRAFSRRRAT